MRVRPESDHRRSVWRLYQQTGQPTRQHGQIRDVPDILVDAGQKYRCNNSEQEHEVQRSGLLLGSRPQSHKVPVPWVPRFLALYRRRSLMPRVRALRGDMRSSFGRLANFEQHEVSFAEFQTLRQSAARSAILSPTRPSNAYYYAEEKHYQKFIQTVDSQRES